MKVSQNTVLIIAAIVWHAGGIALLLKGSSLLKQAYEMNSEPIWTVIAALIGVVTGLAKSRFLFIRSCKKNIQRIKAIANPRVWQCFKPGLLIFLAVMIPTGAWMSKAVAGNYLFLCLVGALDLSLAVALLTSSLVFWNRSTFTCTRI
jgi:hypothetical protein